MTKTSAVTFTAGYDFERKLEDFLAQRSSALAANSTAARHPILIDLVGVDVDDPRTSTLRSQAPQLGLRLRFC